MLEKLTAIPPSFASTDGKKISLTGFVFLIMLCVASFSPGLATMPPTDRDESLFAQASKQMVENGDVTDIKVQNEPRYKKPIGIYWLQSASARLLTPHDLSEIWAYRLPSLVAATVAVIMTAALGALLFNPVAGLLAGMMLSGGILMNVEARLATTDATLLACITVAMYSLARAYLGQASGWRVPLIFWSALAFGILTKGPIILLPIGGVLLWTGIANKSLSWFKSLRPLLGLLYTLALVAPWFVAIMLHSHGAFLQQSAGHDMLAKIWQSQNRGGLPPGLHLLVLPIMFFPFSLLVVFAAPDAWKGRQETAIKFLLGWIIPTWIVFELSLTKLPHYVLPTYPALALLTAKFLLDGLPSMSTTMRRVPLALIIGMWLVTGFGIALFFAFLPFYVDGKALWPQIIAGALLIIAQGAALFLLPRHKRESVIALTIGSLIFISATFGDTLPRLEHLWVSREITEIVDQIKPCPHSVIVASGYHEPSLVFLGGTDTLLVPDGAATAAALKQDACRVAVIDTNHKQEFLDAFASNEPQPIESGSIGGLNAGHGSQTALTIYRLAPTAAP